MSKRYLPPPVLSRGFWHFVHVGDLIGFSDTKIQLTFLHTLATFLSHTERGFGSPRGAWG
jgi:hypothetical protein